MSKERFNRIIDEVFINYCQTKIEKTSTGEIWISYAGHYGIISKEEFINKCKTDNEFSQELGLKIEERELSLEERMNLIKDSDEYDDKIIIAYCENPFDEWLEGQVNEILIHRNIPTKLITLTYNNETIECYE